MTLTLDLFGDSPAPVNAPNVPDNAPEMCQTVTAQMLSAQRDDYVAETTAILRFCDAIKKRGFGEYLTIGGNVDYRQAARLCNDILGRAASDRPTPEPHDWVNASHYGLDRNLDRMMLAKLTPDSHKGTAQ